MAAGLAFGVFRAVDLLAFVVVARVQDVPALRLLRSWDGGWLTRAALEGWPSALPVDSTGTVQQSTWNWPPMAPLVGRAAASVLDDRFAWLAIAAVNLAGGAVAAVLLCLTLRPFVGASRALGSSVAWSALPAAPVLLMAYTEGLFVAFAFASLWAATRRRYLLAGALLVPAGMTRVTALPFAAAVVIAMLLDARRTRSVPAPVLAGTVVLAAVSSVIWPVYAALRLGAVDAYAMSQSAWGRSDQPFHDTVAWLGSALTSPTLDTSIGLVVLVAYLVAAVTVVRDRTYPPAFRALAVTFPAFLLVAGPGWATARQLLPDPALGAAIRSWLPRTVVFVAVVVLLVALRVGWIVVYVSAPAGSPPP